MTVPKPEPIELALHDQSMRLRFQWNADRFDHQFFIQGMDGSISSLQGTADQPWPPSAPLQQISLEDISGVPTVLAVGAAGVSHWSLSAQAVEVSGAKGFKFEYACRVKSQPQWLGSTYAASDRLTFQAGRDTQIEVGDQIRVFPAELASGTIQWNYLVLLNNP